MPQAQARAGVEEWSFGSAVRRRGRANWVRYIHGLRREGEPVRFSKDEIAEAAELYSKEKSLWGSQMTDAQSPGDTRPSITFVLVA